MAIEKRNTTVNERTYTMLLPAVRKAMPLCTKVAVLLGPVLSSLNKDAAGGGMEKFAAALQGVNPDKVDAIIMEAIEASHLHCGSLPVHDEISFEQHFSTHRSDVYHVGVWCLWECVKDFFPQLGAFAQTAKKAMESVSPTDGQ